MATDLHIASRVFIPGRAFEVRAVRSSGPGGQNVNKVASKIELRVAVDEIVGLSPEARVRLESLVASRVDAAGRVLIRSQKTRDQQRNLQDARAKLAALVRRALVALKARRPTRVPAAARDARLASKKRRGEAKRERRALSDDD